MYILLTIANGAYSWVSVDRLAEFWMFGECFLSRSASAWEGSFLNEYFKIYLL